MNESMLSGKQPVELVAVINSFNRRELLERSLESLTRALRATSFGWAIVVFEAGSKDGSSDFLESWRSRNPHDSLIVENAPPGRSSFSDGVNLGCTAALARFPQCEWLFLYETDNWLEDAEPIRQAISLFKSQPHLGGVGFTVKQHNGIFCGYGMRFPTYLSLALGQNLSFRWHLEKPNESPWQTVDDIRWRTCDAVFTSPLLIRRQAWDQSAGFDAKAFPFSDSDLDWAWRCSKLGWKMGVIASEKVVHDNLEQASPGSINRVVDFHRGRLRLLRRHRGNREILIKPVLFIRHCLETIALAFRASSDPTLEAKLAKRRQMLATVWNNYS